MKSVLCCENRIRVYENGTVRRIVNGAEQDARVYSNSGYDCVWDGKEQRGIHRLVAESFIPNPLHKPQVNHIDGNKKNNDVSNLEWVTQKENLEHARRTGLLRKPYTHERFYFPDSDSVSQ